MLYPLAVLCGKFTPTDMKKIVLGVKLFYIEAPKRPKNERTGRYLEG